MPTDNTPPPEHEPVGQFLKKRRDMAGLSVDDIAAQLCIQPVFITAIEEGHDSELPEEVYVIGFIKSYARFLDLDVPKIIVDYKREGHHKLKNPELVFPESETDHRVMPPIAIVCGVVILVAAYLFWVFSDGSQTKPVSQPVVDPASLPYTGQNIPPTVVSPHRGESVDASGDSKEQEQTLAIKSPQEHTQQHATAAGGKGAVETAQEDAAPGDLHLHALDWCKIVVKNARGERIFVGTLQPGDEWNLPQQGGPFTFSTDSLGAVAIRHGNEMSLAIGVKNIPAENLALTVSTFNQHRAKKGSVPAGSKKSANNSENAAGAPVFTQNNFAQKPVRRDAIPPHPEGEANQASADNAGHENGRNDEDMD